MNFFPGLFSFREQVQKKQSTCESHSAKLCQGQHDLAGGRPGEDDGTCA